MYDKIVKLIIEVAENCNEDLDKKIEVKRGADAPLYGSEGVLDSIGLVTFIVSVEQELEDQLDINLTLADEKAASQKHSPFRTVGTLAAYTVQRIEEGD